VLLLGFFSVFVLNNFVGIIYSELVSVDLLVRLCLRDGLYCTLAMHGCAFVMD
jgi:hypothetical protein